MMDALLYSTLAAVRTLGYGSSQSNIMATGEPPPQCGDVFVAVHPGATRSTNDNCLMEFFEFKITLTMRVTVPLDRVGDQLLARKLAQDTGFNRRAEQIRALMHMNWGALQDANQYLVDLTPDVVVYGFCEPSRYRGMDLPALVGPEWFWAEMPEGRHEVPPDTGLKAELRFDDARRMQPIAQYV